MRTASEARAAVLVRLEEYAQGRKADVARGAETPHLAGLLLQKYGYGLCDAFWEVFDHGEAGPTYADVDQVVASIDPDWRENGKARWAGRPADLAVGSAEGS